MKIKVDVQISRMGDDIRIELTDRLSNAHFVTVTMGCADFAKCLTSLYTPNQSATVRGLDVVGKVRVSEPRQVRAPLLQDDSYGQLKYSAWLEENCQEDGWILNSALRSRDSVIRKDSYALVNYSVTKYVDPPETDDE